LDSDSAFRRARPSHGSWELTPNRNDATNLEAVNGQSDRNAGRSERDQKLPADHTFKSDCLGRAFTMLWVYSSSMR